MLVVNFVSKVGFAFIWIQNLELLLCLFFTLDYVVSMNKKDIWVKDNIKKYTIKYT